MYKKGITLELLESVKYQDSNTHSVILNKP